MIQNRNILHIGPNYRKPKGGIAQLLNTYSKCIFVYFRHVTASTSGDFAKKISILILAICRLIFSLLFSNISIVHIHTASDSDFKRNLLFVNIARFFRKTTILHIHGGGFRDFYENNRQFVEKSLRKVDAIIALSEVWKSFFSSITPNKNIFIVHNIIPKPQNKTKSNHAIFNLLYLGHIYEKKGIFDLLGVIQAHQADFQSKLVLHVGGGLYEVDRLKNYITRNHLEDVIVFHGWVSGEEKKKLLQDADAFILPSYAEGVPISILEAMSYHLPIISTNVGGIPSIVSDKNGFLVEPGNLSQIYLAINSLLESKSLCKKMGEESYNLSVLYQPENVILELSTVYRLLLK